MSRVPRSSKLTRAQRNLDSLPVGDGSSRRVDVLLHLVCDPRILRPASHRMAIPGRIRITGAYAVG